MVGRNAVSETTSAETPPDPLRNVTSSELLVILNRGGFAVPDSGISQAEWQAAIAQVRAALEQHDLDLPLDRDRDRGPHLNHDVCAPINRIISTHPSIGRGLLHNHVVAALRTQMGRQLAIRTRLGSHPEFSRLIAFLRGKNGEKIDPQMLKEQGFGSFLLCCWNIASDIYGDGHDLTRKETAWRLIREFLTEQAGVEVHLAVKFIHRPKSKPAAKKTLPEIGIPRSVHVSRVNMERTRGLLQKQANAHLVLVRAELERIELRKREIQGQLSRARDKIRAADQSLTKFHEEGVYIQRVFEELRQLMARAEQQDEKEFKLPRAQAKRREERLAELQKRFKPHFTTQEILEAEIAELERQLAQLEQLRNQLRQEEATMYAAARRDEDEEEDKKRDAPSSRLSPVSPRHEEPASRRAPPPASPRAVPQPAQVHADPPRPVAPPPSSPRLPQKAAPPEAAAAKNTQITTMARLFEILQQQVFVVVTPANKALLEQAKGARAAVQVGSVYMFRVELAANDHHLRLVPLSFSGTPFILKNDIEVARMNLSRQNPNAPAPAPERRPAAS